jgi:hypothetical protein
VLAGSVGVQRGRVVERQVAFCQNNKKWSLDFRTWKIPRNKKRKEENSARTVGNEPCRKKLVAKVARFFFVQNTKTGKNIPNDHKIYQMAIKYFLWP